MKSYLSTKLSTVCSLLVPELARIIDTCDTILLFGAEFLIIKEDSKIVQEIGSSKNGEKYKNEHKNKRNNFMERI